MSQINFRQPEMISEAISEGIRALAESSIGSITDAHSHCINSIESLTEAKLNDLKGKNPPKFSRDKTVFLSLVWLLLLDGMLKHRPLQAVRTWFFKIIAATDLFEGQLSDADFPSLLSLFEQSIHLQAHISAPSRQEISGILSKFWEKGDANEGERALPNSPNIFVGRAANIEDLKHRIGFSDKASRSPLTIIRGWPGVGKTALVNELANDKSIAAAFEHGILWASLGHKADLFMALKTWARELGARHLSHLKEMKELAEGLRLSLKGKDILIIVDDIWTEEEGNFVKSLLDLQHNTVLLTTRFTDIAERLREIPANEYIVQPLSVDFSIEVLAQLAPNPVKSFAHRMPQLVQSVEGLPLALHVAGPLLQRYHDLHFDIDELLDEFEADYNRLLEAKAPSDRFDEETGTSPTIELLFQRSVQTLNPKTQEAFALLGLLKEKPASFDMRAMAAVWEVDDPKDLITAIVGRGLLESKPDKRFHIHQTLHMYANKLIDRFDATGSLF